MALPLVPLFSFVLITTFTPGPNNLSSAALGITRGYRRSLPYLLGISCGFFLVMLICASFSHLLLQSLPAAQGYLQFFGALYIVWLALAMLRSDGSAGHSEEFSHPFLKGLGLQLCNPKVLVYGLTLYTSFLAPISARPVYLGVSAAGFALTAFVATSSWALFGTVIGAKLENQRLRRSINLVLAALLLYTAMELSGILSWSW